jgi:inhibitor of KinA
MMIDFTTLHWTLAGDSAVFVRAQQKKTLFSIHQTLREQSFDGYIESYMTLDTLAIIYDARKFELHEQPVIEYIELLLKHVMKAVPSYYIRNQRHLKIPICYDLHLDLDELCERQKLTRQQWIELHSKQDYQVGFIGFTPGFPYLIGLPSQLQIARKSTPRIRLEQGSVAIGGPYCGIYPNSSPGGWHVIGRTPLRLFDATRNEPCLLSAGDLVRFDPISLDAFHSWEVSADDN